MAAETEVTTLLLRWSEGDERAFDQLVPLVYDELKRLAHRRLHGENRDHTLSTTGLAHEAYLRLADIHRLHWRDRKHFFAMASRVMRRVLIDYARHRKAQKRGGGAQRVDIADEDLALQLSTAETLLELDDAIARMGAEHPRQSQALELYYFGGLTQKEIAEVLEVSQPTVAEDLRFARAWLARLWAE